MKDRDELTAAVNRLLLPQLVEAERTIARLEQAVVALGDSVEMLYTENTRLIDEAMALRAENVELRKRLAACEGGDDDDDPFGDLWKKLRKAGVKVKVHYPRA